MYTTYNKTVIKTFYTSDICLRLNSLHSHEGKKSRRKCSAESLFPPFMMGPPQGSGPVKRRLRVGLR
jgi:hypothetical protein